MEIVKNIALISINATLLVQLLSFLLFMWIFNRIMVRPLRQVMQERVRYVDQIHQQIVKADEDFQNVAVQIKRQESDVRRTALSMQADIEAEARASARVVVEQTKQEINGLRRESQKEVNARIADARKQIMTEAELLSDLMVGALLNRRSKQ